MAGHSKWANIKHRKAAQDSKRGKVFTKLIRELVIAAKLGGAVAEDNPRLRAAIDKALSANMTRDTIDRAIKRGSGNDEADNMEEIVYEGYSPGGVAILVECLTNNRNRTVSEVRHAFSKYGGNLGTEGSVAYLFNRMGQIIFDKTCAENDLIEAALNAGAEDILVQEDGTKEVLMPWAEMVAVKSQLEQAGYAPLKSDVMMIPSTSVPLEDKVSVEKLIKMVDHLEDLDDVQNVYSNADIPDHILSSIL